jgi:FlaA1/EpsC-like NDP-sugar epimerase
MLKEKETVIRKAMILLDGLVVCGAFLLSYYLGRYFHVFYKESSLPFADIVNYLPSSIEQYIIILLFAMLLWPAMLYINGAYKAIRTESFFAMVWTVAKSAVYMVFAFGSLIFFLQFKFVSRLFFINFILISAFLIIIEKIIVFYVVKNARKKGHNFKRFLIVGTGKRADSFIAKINNHPEWGFKIEGVIDYEKHPAGKNIKGIEIIGTLETCKTYYAIRPLMRWSFWCRVLPWEKLKTPSMFARIWVSGQHLPLTCLTLNWRGFTRQNLTGHLF